MIEETEQQRNDRLDRETEDWLRANDRNYETASRGWRHMADNGGVYESPDQEVAAGDGEFLEWIVSTGEGRWIRAVAERACEACTRLFMPRESKQRFCSETCRGRMEKRRQRARK